MVFQHQINRIGGYCHLIPYTESHFSRFLNYQSKDFQPKSAVSPEMRALHRLHTLIHDLLDTGHGPDALINFIIEPDLSTLVSIQEHFQWGFSRPQSLKIVLKDQFQIYDWTPQNLDMLAQQIMTIFEQWDLLEWHDLSNPSKIETHELTQMYQHTGPCLDAILNVWADNTGFDPSNDAQYLSNVTCFIQEVLQC